MNLVNLLGEERGRFGWNGAYFPLLGFSVVGLYGVEPGSGLGGGSNLRGQVPLRTRFEEPQRGQCKEDEGGHPARRVDEGRSWPAPLALNGSRLQKLSRIFHSQRGGGGMSHVLRALHNVPTGPHDASSWIVDLVNTHWTTPCLTNVHPIFATSCMFVPAMAVGLVLILPVAALAYWDRKRKEKQS